MLNQPVSWMFLMSIMSSVASCSSSPGTCVYWNGTWRGWSQSRVTTASERLDRSAARIAPATRDRPGRSIVTCSHIDSPGSLGGQSSAFRTRCPVLQPWSGAWTQGGGSCPDPEYGRGVAMSEDDVVPGAQAEVAATPTRDRHRRIPSAPAHRRHRSGGAHRPGRHRGRGQPGRVVLQDADRHARIRRRGRRQSVHRFDRGREAHGVPEGSQRDHHAVAEQAPDEQADANAGRDRYRARRVRRQWFHARVQLAGTDRLPAEEPRQRSGVVEGHRSSEPQHRELRQRTDAGRPHHGHACDEQRIRQRNDRALGSRSSRPAPPSWSTQPACRASRAPAAIRSPRRARS